MPRRREQREIPVYPGQGEIPRFARNDTCPGLGMTRLCRGRKLFRNFRQQPLEIYFPRQISGRRGNILSALEERIEAFPGVVGVGCRDRRFKAPDCKSGAVHAWNVRQFSGPVIADPAQFFKEFLALPFSLIGLPGLVRNISLTFQAGILN